MLKNRITTGAACMSPPYRAWISKRIGGYTPTQSADEGMPTITMTGSGHQHDCLLMLGLQAVTPYGVPNLSDDIRDGPFFHT